MHCLVTGGTGFLGSRLVREMVGLGWRVTVLSESKCDLNSLSDVRESIRVCDASDAASAFGQVDVVVHTATRYGQSGEGALEVVGANLLFPLQVLSLAAEHHAKLFCNTDTILDRRTNSYALSKKQFQEWLGFAAERGEVRGVNLLLDQFYGPGENPSRFVTWIVRQCLANESIPLTSGVQKRRFLHVEDLVRGYIAAIRAALEREDPYLEYHIAAGTAIKVRELVEKVHAMTDSHAALRFGAVPLRVHEPDVAVDLAPMRALGWNEQVTLEQGIAGVIEFERRRSR